MNLFKSKYQELYTLYKTEIYLVLPKHLMLFTTSLSYVSDILFKPHAHRQFQLLNYKFQHMHAYTLSQPENDRDVTGRAEGNTLQDASFRR